MEVEEEETEGLCVCRRRYMPGEIQLFEDFKARGGAKSTLPLLSN